MVQSHAARYITNRHRNRSCVTDMVSHLGWNSLETRRKVPSLCMLFKIKHELVTINKSDRLSPRTPTMPDWATTTTSSHNQSVITGRRAGTGTDYLQTFRQQSHLGLLSLKWLHTLLKLFFCFKLLHGTYLTLFFLAICYLPTCEEPRICQTEK